MVVTVLMPVYNAEEYLRDSVESLLNQTSQQWKLICIDDGSTDASRFILEEYCKQDKRIKLITQANTGPAMARARAIELVDTEYIAILDSDDAYSSNYVELMLKRAEETNADSIVPDVFFGYGNTPSLPNMFIQHQLSPDMIISNGMEAFKMTFPWKLHGWQMVKTELAKKYYTVENASYSKFNSDEYITRLLYLKSEKTVLCQATYLYRIALGSITRTVSLKKLDYLATLDRLLMLCEKERIDYNLRVEVYNDFYQTLISMWKLTARLADSERKEGQKKVIQAYHQSYIKRFDRRILQAATLKTKVKFIVSMLSFGIIKMMAK